MIAAKPVRAPLLTPVVDSTKDVTVEVPTIEPNTVPIASIAIAFWSSFKCPSSSTNPESWPTATNVPAVSKKSTNKKVNITAYASGFANTVLKPSKHPPKTLATSLIDSLVPK